MFLVTGALLTAALAGCITDRYAIKTIPAWELASADPGAMVRIARTRSRPDRPLPERVLQKLCPEFSLITINRSSDWSEVRRCLELPPSDVAVNFSEGMVVGIQAHVGERAEPGWPTHIETVRLHGGAGRIEIAFQPGLYYPLDTGGYVELIYVSDLRRVRTVCIDHRTFVIADE